MKNSPKTDNIFDTNYRYQYKETKQMSLLLA